MLRRALAVFSMVLTLAGFLDARPALAQTKTDKTPAGGKLPEHALLRLGGGGVLTPHFTSVALSPDGKLLATTDGNLCAVRDLAADKELFQLKNPRPPFSQAYYPAFVQFAPGGKRLVFGNTSRFLVVEVPSGKTLQTITNASAKETYRDRFHIEHFPIGVSADGTIVAVFDEGENAQVKLFSTESGKLLNSLPGAHNARQMCALSHDGALAATWGDAMVREPGFKRPVKDKIAVKEKVELKLEPKLEPKDDPDDFQAGLKKAQKLKRTVQLWNAATGKLVGDIETEIPIQFNQPSEYLAPTRAVAFSPDGKTLAILNENGDAMIYDVAGRKLLRKFPTSAKRPSFAEFSADGKALVAVANEVGGIGDSDKSLAVHQVETGERVPLPKNVRSLGNVLAVAAPSADRILAVGKVGLTLAWGDVISGKIGAAPAGHAANVSSLNFTPSGETLMAVSDDGEFILWNPENGDIEHRGQLGLPFQPHQPRSIALAPDGATIARSGGNGAVEIRHLLADRTLMQHRVKEFPTALAFSPRGDKVALATQSQLHLLDIPNKKETASVAMPGRGRGDVLALEIAPDEKTAALVFLPFEGGFLGGKPAAQVHLVDLDKGKSTQVRAAGLRLAFTADGKHFIALDKDISLIDVATGAIAKKLPIEEKLHASVARSSPDGKTLAVATTAPGGGPATIELFDLPAGTSRLRLRGHDAFVSSLAFSPSGDILASGSADNTIILWKIK